MAVLDRTRPQQRKFKRIVGRQLARLLEAEAAASTPTDAPSDAEDGESSDTPTATTDPKEPKGTTDTTDSGGDVE